MTNTAPPSRAKRALRLLAQIVVVGLALGYVARVLWTNTAELEAQLRDVRLSYVLLSLPFGFAYMLGRGLIWHRIVLRLAGPSPLWLDVAVWLASTLGKYLPGKVFMLLGRVFAYKKRGIAASTITLGFLYETAVVFATAFVFMLVALDIPADPAWRWVRPSALVGLTAFAIGSHPRLLGLIASRIAWLRAPGERLSAVRARDPWMWTALMAANWAVLGVGFYLLTAAFVPTSARSAPHLIASYALAGISGIAVVLAPGGLGVREGVLTVLLSPTLGPAGAATLAIASRLWMTVSEVTSALIALPYVRHDATVQADEEPAAGDRQ